MSVLTVTKLVIAVYICVASFSNPRVTCSAVGTATGSEERPVDRLVSDGGEPMTMNDKPNIIYIMADDMGYHDIGYLNEEVITPNLDALAHSGVIMDQAYAQHTCTPSRVALMTSVYPYKSKMQHGVLGDLNPACVPLDLKFLPERLREHGYRNHMLGKWHLGFCREECLPTRRGFDTFYGLWTGAETYYTRISGGYFDTPGYDWRDNETVDYSDPNTYHSDLVAKRAVEIIEDSGDDEPFFMHLSYINPHTPLEAPEEYKNMYGDKFTDGRRTLLGMVTAMDDSIGRVMEALKKSGKENNTIIIFSSDNGGDMHGFSDNGPFRAFKTSLYEGGNRVAMFIHGAMLEKTGYHHGGMFHISDWGPTLLSMIGAPIDASEGLDGVDQSTMLVHGGPSARHEMVYNIDLEPGPYFGQAALRIGDWKLIWGLEGQAVGRGLGNAIVFHKSEENQRLIAEYKAAQSCPRSAASRKKRSAPELHSRQKRETGATFNPQEAADMATLYLIKNFDTKTLDVTSGATSLFNLRDDPYEYNNLADNPEYLDKVRSLQYHMKDLVRGYKKPEPTAGMNLAAGHPDLFNGTFSTGWCNDYPQMIGTSGT